MRPAFFAALGALLVATGALAQAPAPLRIGLSAPLTGPDSAFGQGVKTGAEQAIADLNRAGGVAGRMLSLVIVDDAGDARQGAIVARKLAADRVTLVVGPLNSAVAAVALPIFEEAGIVAVTPGAAWAPLTARGLWNVFRITASDAEQGAVAGAYLAERFKGRRIGLVHDKTTFGRGLVDDVARALKANGQREAAFESLSRGDKDLSGVAARLKRAQVDVVYFGGWAQEAGLLIRALRDAGLDAPLMGGDGLIDKDFAQIAGPGAEGTLMTFLPEPRRLPETKGASGKPRSPEAEMFAARAYAAVEVMAQAVARAKTTEGRKVAATLRDGMVSKTVIGEIAFNAKGDLARPSHGVATWRRTPDGRLDYAGAEPAP